jgi:hypothetical protein
MEKAAVSAHLSPQKVTRPTSVSRRPHLPGLRLFVHWRQRMSAKKAREGSALHTVQNWTVCCSRPDHGQMEVHGEVSLPPRSAMFPD